MSDPHHPGAGPRILAIGLEAADPGLIERWCAAGHLPFLASLKRRGAWARLASSTDISSGATWASVITGVNPAKHGMAFYHRQLRPGSYEIRKKYADEIGREPFWMPLSRAGKRVAILDVPETYPMPGMSGMQIVGWGAEGLNWKPSSTPPDLLRDLEARFGKHPLAGWYQARPETIDGWQELLGNLVAGLRARTSLASDVLGRERWDLCLVAFAETHWAGHFFWHLLDETHPEHDATMAKAFGDAMLEVYKEIDGAIAALARRMPGATLLVFSNTGMGPNYSGRHLVPEILKRLGMTGDRPGRDGSDRHRLDAVTRIERIVSPRIIERVKKIVPERIWDVGTRRLLGIGNGWKRSRAFALPSDFTGAIRINLKGREPNGLVEPGREYDALCAELAEAFGALVDPELGRKAVVEVLKLRNLVSGEHIDELPDLIVKWTRDAPITALYAPQIGTVRGDLEDKRSGAHSLHGFVLASGPGLRRRPWDDEPTIMDIGPTISHLLGVPVTGDVDGRPLLDRVDEAAIVL
jgi:predicted AlkP superfamily phosphohydrolase/phosphomutase